MSKECINCGHCIPEEANFCLQCFTIQHDKLTAKVPPVITRSVRFRRAIYRNRKRIIRASAVVCCLFISAGVLLTVLGQRPAGPTMVTADGTPAASQEEKSKLEKIVDKIFHPDYGTSERDDESFFDILFGNDESTSGTETQSADGSDEENSGWGNFWDNLFGGGKDQEEKPTTPPQESEEDHPSDPPTTEKPTEPQEKPAEPEFDRFEYEPDPSSSKGVRITKYTGNATHVKVPAMLDGKFVTRIGEGTFLNNSKITKITFLANEDRPYLDFDNRAINNCLSLTEIELPDENLGIWYNSISACPSMRNIMMPDNFQFRFWEGGLYYWSGKEWSMRYYCPDYPAEQLLIPSWSSGIESGCDLTLATHLKRICYHKDVHLFNAQYIPKTLEAFEVEDGNPWAYDLNGWLIKKSSSTKKPVYYPPANRARSFKLPENTEIDTFNFIPNAHLQELWIPKTSGVRTSSIVFHTKQVFPNLNTVYIGKGHPLESEIRSTFKGNIYTY